MRKQTGVSSAKLGRFVRSLKDQGIDIGRVDCRPNGEISIWVAGEALDSEAAVTAEERAWDADLG